MNVYWRARLDATVLPFLRDTLKRGVLNEGDIKAAVIDRLFASAALSDAVLINEMVIANWSRRADLVVANGKLHAFEIKSDFDSLRRLQGQVETYLSRFDKVTVVCTPKFAQLVRDCTESRVEKYLTRSPCPSARRNSKLALGSVLPITQVCIRIGDERSASFWNVISANSARSAV